MTPEAESLVRCIHRAGVPFALAATGGGSEAVAELLRVPGGSHSVLEAIVPYSSESLTALLKARPEQFCSSYTARLMAMAAYERAVLYQRQAGAAGPVAGVGCTASLVSDRPKKGPHRIHVAGQTATLTATASLELEKGARDRAEEELLAAHLLLNMVAQACAVAERIPLALRNDERVDAVTLVGSPWCQKLFAGEIDAVLVRGQMDDDTVVRRVAGQDADRAGFDTGKATPDVSVLYETGSTGVAPQLVFPGAFHPLHGGHMAMAMYAAARLRMRAEWEISITNVDKPPLDFVEMQTRVSQFAETAPVWLTRAPTFVEKSAIFPAATFIVGADTITRIAEPRYYHDDAQACRSAIAQIARQGCRFLVFGRKTATGYETLSDLPLPPELRAICDEVSEIDFRMDISSTDIRRHATDG